MFYVELAPGGYFRPPKVSFSTIFVILDVFVFMRQFFHIVIYTDKKNICGTFLKSESMFQSHLNSFMAARSHSYQICIELMLREDYC